MSKFLLFCKQTKILIKCRCSYFKFYVINFLCKFIPYLENMSLDKEKLISDLNKIVHEHFEKFNGIKLFVINDATLPLNVSSNDYSKIKHSINYKIQNNDGHSDDTPYFNVFVYCKGKVIETIKPNYNCAITIDSLQINRGFS